jgi:hypothetical protein
MHSRDGFRLRDSVPFWPLDPGSMMGKKSGFGIRIRDEQSGSYFLELRKHFFGLKYGSGIRDGNKSDLGSRIWDKHPGSATLDGLMIDNKYPFSICLIPFTWPLGQPMGADRGGSVHYASCGQKYSTRRKPGGFLLPFLSSIYLDFWCSILTKLTCISSTATPLDFFCNTLVNFELFKFPK